MRVELRPGSIWATLHGPRSELAAIVEMVDGWSASLTPRGAARPVYLWRDAGASLQLLTGIVALLVQWGALRGEAYGQVDGARVRALADSLVDEGLVRDYQADAAVGALLAPLGRGLVEVAMGGGKTYICALIAVLGAAVGRGRWLYLVQNKELAQQSRASFEHVMPLMSRALCEAGGAPLPPAVLTATTYSGIGKRSGDGEEKTYDGVLVDECHLLPAPTRCVPFASVDAWWRVGLSGTALDRQDGGNPLVVGLLGPSVFSITIDQLESRGFLSRGRVESVLYPGNGGPYRGGGFAGL